MKLIQHVEIQADWPEYGSLFNGAPIRLADVEATLPAGAERAGVSFVHARGHTVWPWKEAGYYVDDNGEAIAPVFDVVPMTRGDLARRGLTDEDLMREHARLLAKKPPLDLIGPDVAELQVRRRQAYEALCVEWYRT